MSHLHPTLRAVTARVSKRSAKTRAAYLRRLAAEEKKPPARTRLSCSNLAHGVAACAAAQRSRLVDEKQPRANIAIVSAYNDMLSAHQPYARFADIIKRAAAAGGGSAQFAGGTPAMCDGVTQGRAGMELSLFSRDVIAQSTAVALSHDMFDGAAFLGICDKIVPGLLIGALSFGHLPSVFIPGGPMPSGLPNREKSEARRLFAEKKIGRVQMLKVESQSYHSPGTCTFYGTANSNQFFLEAMGLQLPGGTFINPQEPLRDALTAAATARLLKNAKRGGENPHAIGRQIDARAIINAVVALLATGGSTNHTIHLVAIARAAGLILDWRDFEELSRAAPLLARVYPNGDADVNAMREAGDIPFILRELLAAGFLHDEVQTILGRRLSAHFFKKPSLAGGKIHWRAAAAKSGDSSVLRAAAAPFAPEGGLRLMRGNLGRGIIKISAVAQRHRRVRALAKIFSSQDEFLKRFAKGEFKKDFVAVVRHQGARANGMPELHKLTPALSSLQNRGLAVALVTDGRMSGASGQVPAVIHLHPEAARGGPLAKVRAGDVISIDAARGKVDNLAADFSRRKSPPFKPAQTFGLGRELFAGMRERAASPEEGAVTFGDSL